MSNVTLPKLETGWTYTQAGTPVAYVMLAGDPGKADVTAFESWWKALHYAVLYAEIYPRARYMGGPE